MLRLSSTVVQESDCEELRLRAAATELRPVNTAAAWPRNFERLWVLGRLVTYCHLHSKLFAYQATISCLFDTERFSYSSDVD